VAAPGLLHGIDAKEAQGIDTQLVHAAGAMGRGRQCAQWKGSWIAAESPVAEPLLGTLAALGQAVAGCVPSGVVYGIEQTHRGPEAILRRRAQPGGLAGATASTTISPNGNTNDQRRARRTDRDERHAPAVTTTLTIPHPAQVVPLDCPAGTPDHCREN
jgi:hypothetical protein